MAIFVPSHLVLSNLVLNFFYGHLVLFFQDQLTRRWFWARVTFLNVADEVGTLKYVTIAQNPSRKLMLLCPGKWLRGLGYGI